jgi:hypothetical protein
MFSGRFEDIWMRQAQTLNEAQFRRVLQYCQTRRHPLRDRTILLVVRRRMIWNRRPNSGAEVLGSSGLGYAA